MQANNTPVVKDLVLIGGGHSHVIVLKKFAMKPMPGLRITLITRDIHTPYSGMLPGYIAGHYDYDECHIDLAPLARFAGARIYHAEVESIDLKSKLIKATGRPDIHYDLVSINTGSRPNAMTVEGAEEHSLPVKPIDLFLEKWQLLTEKVIKHKGEFKLMVVGGGAGGVESALSTQHRLTRAIKDSNSQCQLKYTLLAQSDCIMFAHNQGVRERFEHILKQRDIEVKTSFDVIKVNKDSIQSNDETLPIDGVIWVTTAAAPKWPKQAGLEVDENGFIKVNKYLQSISHPDVFVAGDIASLPDPRPKSGVFAVRQGPFLAKNLRAAAINKSFSAYKPQKNFLGLISTGDQFAVASYGKWTYASKGLWKIKDWIDRSFMQKFSQLPEMTQDDNLKLSHGIADQQAIKELSTLAMRCGGCGAKVGATTLSRVLKRLPNSTRDDVLIGRDAPDDCAMLAVPKGKVMVQSVDYFRAFIEDSYTFGAISANHALGDVYAMGAEPQSVLAIATVPYGREVIVEETLYDVLAGALSIIEPSGAVLAGGHSSEGAELAFGLTVNGLCDPKTTLRKSGMQAGDVLILTKSIGTGTLLAADMRYKAKGRWVDNALQSMLQSNQLGAKILLQYNASACTDVTGFGLLGHLVEMTKASEVDAVLNIESIPLLDGAKETVTAGILSSLQPANLRLRRGIENFESAAKHSLYPLLFDPQTAGGLLASVPAKDADQCLTALRQAGYGHAEIIGNISSKKESKAPISIH